MVLVRKAVREDIPALISLFKQFMKDQYSRSKYYNGDFSDISLTNGEYYEDVMSRNTCEVFVAELDGRVVAMAEVKKYGPNFIFEFGEHGYMFNVFIEEGSRKFVISHKLFEACRKWSKDNGCKYFSTCTYGFNSEVRKLLEHKDMEVQKTVYVINLDEEKLKE